MNSSYSFTLRLKSLLLSKVKLNTSKICETFSSESFATWLSWLTTFVSFSAGKGKTPSLIFEDDHSFTISSSDLLDFVTVSSICELKDELFSNNRHNSFDFLSIYIIKLHKLHTLKNMHIFIIQKCF